MPIGTSKIGVLGAGVVPGGTETFNAPGTFSVPPGVSKVNITGKGGTGNPGNAGNSGNAGNPGSGGAGGAGGVSLFPFNSGRNGAPGGHAWRPSTTNFGFPPATCFTNWLNAGSAPAPFQPQISIAGRKKDFTNCNPCQICSVNGNNSQSGVSGNAGNAGTAGNPGNTGGTSSGISKCFTGGAGGNAGVAGAAGNSGSGGPGGGAGGNFAPGNPGSAGTGAGAGGSGGPLPHPAPGSQRAFYAGGGGGGAGITNDGSAGRNATINPGPCAGHAFARGGNLACSPSINTGNPAGATPCFFNNQAFPRPPTTVANDIIGGIGSGSGCQCTAGRLAISLAPTNGMFNCPLPAVTNRTTINQFPAPIRPQAYRAGGGGGLGGGGQTSGPAQMAGGGGGGARGGEGNPGGSSSAPSGSAATPSTFNCVAVTPGSSYPITVASPGGQIVISWNPQ